MRLWEDWDVFIFIIVIVIQIVVRIWESTNQTMDLAWAYPGAEFKGFHCTSKPSILFRLVNSRGRAEGGTPPCPIRIILTHSASPNSVIGLWTSGELLKSAQ